MREKVKQFKCKVFECECDLNLNRSERQVIFPENPSVSRTLFTNSFFPPAEQKLHSVLASGVFSVGSLQPGAAAAETLKLHRGAV